MTAALDRVGSRIRTKLVNVFGEDEGERLAADTLQAVGLESLESVDDRRLFGEALIERGGLATSIGRAIATQAILHGAVARIDSILSAR